MAHARVPASLRWLVLGAALFAAVVAVLLDVGPPLWFEILSVRWVSVRVPLLSWLVGMLAFLLCALAVLSALGSVLQRISPGAPPSAVGLESKDSLGRFALFVLFALGVVLTLLAAWPSLAMLRAEADPERPLRLRPEDPQRLASGSFVALDFAADARCRVDLQRFGRGTYDTRQRWQPAPAPAGEGAAIVLRYVAAPPGRGAARLEQYGDTGYVAGPVPRSIQVELARLGCPVRQDAQLLIASRGPPLPWLRLLLFAGLLLALAFALRWSLRKP